MQIQPTYAVAFPGQSTDLILRPTFSPTAGSGNTLVDILINPIVNQTGGASGSVTGILFAPSIGTINGQLIAFQNLIGDVLFQSSGTTGSVGIFGVPTPTARLHVGAGAAGTGAAPVKINTGVFQTVPEQGAIEYNGTNITFVRTGTTRESFLTAVTAAAPGTSTVVLPTTVYGTGAAVLTTPTSWAQVNIAGTTFKIPVY
jgi:hypothetical protein